MEHMLSRIAAAAGLVVMIALCYLFSTNRQAAGKRWTLIIWAMALQFAFGWIVLRTDAGHAVFKACNDIFVAVINSSMAGAEFVFGPLVKAGNDVNFATTGWVTEMIAAGGEVSEESAPRNEFWVFAAAVLPTIIFFSALTSILYHLGIMQIVVKGIAWVMQRTLKTSGAETLSAAGNIFVGQTEAPLLIRPYIARLTRSELMTVMTGGFATVAGGVLAAYVIFLKPSVPEIAGHLLAASVMSAPAALLFGKLLVPEEETPETAGTLTVSVEKRSVNVIDAAAVGTTDGLHLALNVGAMLIAFIALIALADLILVQSALLFVEEVPDWWNLKGLLGYALAPVALLIGVPDWNEALKVGQLLGVKVMMNEFVAFIDLGNMGAAGEIQERTRIIAAYALCGFANFSSIGIQIGGLSAMAPERRADLSRLGLRAMIAGVLAANATACVAAILI